MVGMPTTAAGPDYAYSPAASAPAVQRLLDAGAIVLGKTSFDQFATGLVGCAARKAPLATCSTRRMFDGVGAILAPATPSCAPLLGQKTFVLDGLELPVRPNLGLFTQPISFIGLPVVAVPMPGAVPIAGQLIAR